MTFPCRTVNFLFNGCKNLGKNVELPLPINIILCVCRKHHYEHVKELAIGYPITFVQSVERNTFSLALIV
jgi:hypothetical protein